MDDLKVGDVFVSKRGAPVGTEDSAALQALARLTPDGIRLYKPYLIVWVLNGSFMGIDASPAVVSSRARRWLAVAGYWLARAGRRVVAEFTYQPSRGCSY